MKVRKNEIGISILLGLIITVGCVSSVPIHSAKTLPKGAQNLTVQVGVFEPEGEFETQDSVELIHSASGVTGWSLTYRLGIFNWLEVGLGAGIFISLGADAHISMRVPLLRSSAGTLTTYVRNASRFGLSWFVSGSATASGHIEPNFFYMISTGLTTSFDFMQFDGINLKASIITGAEYGYTNLGWTKVWNWDEEGQIYNNYGFVSHNLIIPAGLSIDFKGMSLGVGARVGIPLATGDSFQSDVYKESYVIKSDFKQFLIYSFRFSYSFRLKKECE